MATFCYSDLEGGPVWEKQFPIGEAPPTITVAGVELKRDYRAEHGVARPVADPWVNHYSLSMGARTKGHAKEIAEKCRAAKVPCEFDQHLRLKVNSDSHQKQLAQAIFPGQNVRNFDGGYRW